jgi:hypothetical protein
VLRVGIGVMIGQVLGRVQLTACNDRTGTGLGTVNSV